jgi:flagellar biosynthesis protein FlhB
VAESEDHDPESATEEATPKKLESLREQGQLVKSAELTAIVSLLAGIVVLLLRLGATGATSRSRASRCETTAAR